MCEKADDVDTRTRRCFVVVRGECNAWETVVKATGIDWQAVLDKMYCVGHHGLKNLWSFRPGYQLFSSEC